MYDIAKIRERMSVIAADGRRVGVVERTGRVKIRVTSVSGSHGYRHLIPLGWVRDVDRYVHLNKESPFVSANWENAQ
jgi:hypothetical protein